MPADPFVAALIAVVAVAALLPASGRFGEVLGAATKIAIALLFVLYGVRLSPTEAWHGLRHWRLHLLVLGATFVVFPLLGLAAHVLVPAVLTPGLYTGVLMLCLVPSTVQSSIAFTSIAHGNVPAAIVSASLSNMLGVVLTPLLVVLLIHTGGTARVDGSAVLDIVAQLLLPFVLGQLLRPWLAGPVARHPVVTKAFDRGSILLVVYTAFSSEHDAARLEHGERLASRRGRGGVRGAVGDHVGGHRRRRPAGAAEPCGHDGAAVLRFEEEPGVGAAHDAGPVRQWCRADHVAAHHLSPAPAGGVRGDREPDVTYRAGAH